MTATEVKFTAGQRRHATELYDQFHAAKAEYKGNTNFSAHRQANDKQYLGIIGKNYYAKPWGNDSSNIQSILNGPSYWKRVYYRPNVAQQFREADQEEAVKAAAERPPPSAGSGLSRSASEPNMMPQIPNEPIPDGYQDIKDKMRPFVERGGKPKIKAPQTGERLNFFNTLGNKYHMKAGGKNINWDVSKSTHRSTPAEARWILSNYFRTDTTAVLSGAGSQPMFD